MAGDWIKVEKSSARKPEVLKMARMLGVSQDAAFGLLVRFWIWLDDNCVDGVVDGVVDTDVDELMACPGLSALLRECKWAKFNSNPPQMCVVNFDRHNGETSKNRALKSERQAKWRSHSVDAEPSTREEKKRKELKPKEEAKTARKRATPMPNDFGISDRVREWAKEKGHGRLEQHLEAFIGKVRAKGYAYIDWDDALMNCIREDWGKVNSAKPQLVEPTRHGSHVPAKLPVNEPHTEMPEHIRAQLSSLTGKLRVS